MHERASFYHRQRCVGANGKISNPFNNNLTGAQRRQKKELGENSARRPPAGETKTHTH